MKTLFVFLPIRYYIKTRRKLWRQYLILLAAGIFVLIGAFALDVRDGVDIEAVFSDFVGRRCVPLSDFFLFRCGGDGDRDVPGRLYSGKGVLRFYRFASEPKRQGHRD